MNPPTVAPEVLLYAGLALVALGLGGTTYALVAGDDTAVHRAFAPYVAALERDVRLLYLKTSGAQIARWQAAAVALFLVAAAAAEDLLFVGGAAAVAVVPRLWLASRVEQRKRRIDAQLDGFLTTLANALKATPSLGDALATTANLLRGPIREDLEFALKENKLGKSLDDALLAMSERIGSRAIGTALTTILIGGKTGGDLTKILERSAATLREMARLEGVVRAKTAEGKTQAYVLGAVPFVIVVLLNAMDPTWLLPLTTSLVGYAIMAGAATMWVVAILIARKILNVDI